MNEKRLSLLLLYFLFFILFGCKKGPERQFRVYRFIDYLEKESIRRSPLARFSGEIETPEKFYPLRSYPVMDLGSGANPYGIKRKLKVGGSEFNMMFAPPKSEYIYRPSLSEETILEFGIGIIRDENSENLLWSERGKERGVNFLITLEIGGRKKTIFQEYFAPPPLKEERTLSLTHHSISLPYTEKRAQISFITKGGQQNFSFWFNPVLYNKGKNSRNLILISIDTLRADHLGCYGYQRETSPFIDSLALDSALFLNTYASSPWTLPSHVSLLTSLHGVHHQVYYEDEKMDPSLITLADILRESHFFCSAFTGGAFVSSVYGFSKGFDSYNEGEGRVFQQDSSERVYRVVSEWLDRNKDKDFFLFIHTYQPHDPYACPYPYKIMFLDEGARWRHINLLGYLGGKRGIFKNLPEEERQNIISLYDSEIRYTDEKLIRPLVEKLKEMQLYDQTMIIFTSDHGEEFYEHQGWEHGHNLYDESLRVPLIIKFPESKFAGKRIRNLVNLIDVVPTVLEEMGLDESHLTIDGQSLIPFLKGKKKGNRIFLADIGRNILNSHIPQKIAMNTEEFKLILNRKFSKKDLEFFLFPPPSMPSIELYDLAKDPLEKKNIAEDKPDLVNQIIQQINEIYSKAEKRKTGKAEIDEKTKEKLRALGYIR